MKTKIPPYVTTAEAAKILRVTDRYVRRLCSEGKLGAKIGRNYIITRENLQYFIQQRNGDNG